MALTFDIHKVHVLIYLNESTNFDIIDYNSSEKSIMLLFSPYKIIRDQI